MQLQEMPAEEMVHMFIKGDEEGIRTFITNEGGTVKYPFRSYWAVAIKARSVMKLDTFSKIESIHFEHTPGQPLLSSSRAQTRVDLVHDGGHGLPQGYTGQGVIMGIIDAGIELQHEDFHFEDGSTRIIELWDQTMAVSQGTPTYGYGQVWDSTEINAGICPHGDQTIWYGHGTNTAGIAAGDGSSYVGYSGIAPETELIVVSSNFTAVGWTNTVADAVDYIFGRAEELGRPCVINASLGTYLGSHDARDFAAQAIEEDITFHPGRIMVCAAGNSGNQAPYHLGYEASEDTTFTWFETHSAASPGNGVIAFEVYGDVGDMDRLQFSVGADRVTPTCEFRGLVPFDSVPNRVNVIHADTLFSESGNFLAKVETYADTLFGTYRMLVVIESIDSVDYLYRFSVTGSGRFDVWSAVWIGYRDMISSGLPSQSQFPDIANYHLPDIKQSIVSSWACSDKVITVGNAINRTSYVDVDNNLVTLSGQTAGNIAGNSSYGPARTGITKPEVVAMGDNTLTAGAFFQLNSLLASTATRNRVGIGGMHHRAGGTSSASPVVAGIAALFLEKCPNASWSDFKQAIQQTTFAEDGFTGDLPNDRWGYGRIDALGALKFTTPDVSVVHPGSEFCEGEVLDVSLSDEFENVLWNTGDTSNQLVLDSAAVLSAIVQDERGCVGYSDTIAFIERPAPLKPILSLEGTMDLCFGSTQPLEVTQTYGSYEWSTGENTQGILVNSNGSCSCTVSNAFDCSTGSDSLLVAVLDEGPSPELHYRADGRLWMSVDSTWVDSIIWYRGGQFIIGASEFSLLPEEAGVYQVSYLDSNACSYSSNVLNVYALGENSLTDLSFSVYPQPMSNVLNISAELRLKKVEILDVRGSMLTQKDVNATKLELDVSDLAEGAYILRLETENGMVMTKRLIK